MDAKITKQRLANLLSYDWLKILLAIVAAIAGLTILFTMIRTRPTTAQRYSVLCFGSALYGEKSTAFRTELDTIFSYEILETNVEQIKFNSTGTQTLMARRATQEGTVAFAEDYSAKEGELTAFAYLCSMGISNAGTQNERMQTYLDLDTYFDECEQYLVSFFGESWQTADIDMEAVRTCFMQRNQKDKRFRSASKREAGVLLEKERIETLREDYLVVYKAIFEDNKLPIVRYDHPAFEEKGVEYNVERDYAVAINVGALEGVKKIFYYTDGEGNRTSEKLHMLIYDNGDSTAFTRYETITLLRYLLDFYAA